MCSGRPFLERLFDTSSEWFGLQWVRQHFSAFLGIESGREDPAAGESVLKANAGWVDAQTAGGIPNATHSGLLKDRPPPAFSKLLRRKYEEAKFQADLDKANIPDLCKCPQCGYQAILPDSNKIFHCPSCSLSSCRHCHKTPHLPLLCSEVAEKSKTSSRTRVEEAMTAARVRECPKCSKRFYKIDGCNKMTCACGTKICYVCREQVVSYAHFCQKAHCKHENCGKCRMYTDAEEDDRQAVKEAGLQEKARVRMEVGGDESLLGDIDVETLAAAEPGKEKKKEKRGRRPQIPRRDHRPHHHHFPHHHHGPHQFHPHQHIPFQHFPQFFNGPFRAAAQGQNRGLAQMFGRLAMPPPARYRNQYRNR